MIYRLGSWVPEIAADCYIAQSAEVIGKVRLLPGSSIWMGAVLRGDMEEIVLGSKTNVQENCSLHTSHGTPLIIGDNVIVGHNATLHSCHVGEGSLIGMGATLLDGAEIGPGSLVAAGALVPPGAKYPEHSVIMGAPAKRVKEQGPANRAEILENVQMYYELGQRYRRDLVPLQETLEKTSASEAAMALREQQWKLSVYLPSQNTEQLEQLKADLFAAGAGQLGSYCQCSWQSEGQGQFRPGASSQPTIGQTGELSQVAEWKLELLFSASCLQQVIQALYAAHPYETPAYDIFPVYYN